MKRNQTGFTIIELTIAILALSVVSLFLIFPFKYNLKTTRDTVRKGNVATIANVIKLSRVHEIESKYDMPKHQVLNILKQDLSILPQVESEKHYFYGYSAKKDDFFVVICGEARSQFFMKGTVNGEQAVNTVFPWNVCDKKIVPIKERFVPLNKKAPSTSLDSYTIYKLI